MQWITGYGEYFAFIIIHYIITKTHAISYPHMADTIYFVKAYFLVLS